MRVIALAVLVVTVFITESVFAASSNHPAPSRSNRTFANISTAVKAGVLRKKYKDDELLVKFKQDVSPERKKALHTQHGAQVKREFPRLRLQHVKLRKGMTVDEAVKLYKSDPSVEYAEPNRVYSVNRQPDDPDFQFLWGLNNATSGADIKAPAAWDITTGSHDVVVLIIDTGIDYTHPDLAGNIYVNPGIDVFNNDSDPFDDEGHGTHVAGTIGAVGNNGVGVAGVNWQVKLTACKFLGADGIGYTDGAIQCLDYLKSLRDAGVNVIASNNSWGGDGSQALYDAIKAQPDVLFIAAAGNESLNSDQTPSYPAGFDLPNVISVAATDDKDTKPLFSNYGKRSVHLSAPGVGIYSTLPASNAFGLPWYGYLSGTSMATPHVTGVASLLKAYNPALDAGSIRNLLLTGGDDVPDAAQRSVTGKRLSAYGSLTCSEKPLLSVQHVPEYVSLGETVALSVISTNCQTPVGPVTGTLTGGELLSFADDGVPPDVVAGDGTFTASYTPIRTKEIIKISSPAGTDAIRFPPFDITTQVLQHASLTAPYSQTLTSARGTAPLTWSVLTGALPPGLSLNSSTGTLTGTASSQGTYYFTVQAADANGLKTVRDLSICVDPLDLAETWRDTTVPGGTIYFSADYATGKLSDIAVDAGGNSYITSILAGGQFYLAKLDANGAKLWSKRFVDGQGENFYSRAVATDSEGSVFMAGIVVQNGLDNIFVGKYDSQGNGIWSRTYVTNGGYGANDVAVDGGGNVVVAGETPNGLVVVKYDGAGNRLWYKDIAVLGYQPFVAADASGNFFVTYYLQNGSRFDFVITKFDSAGNQLWSTTYDKGSEETAQDIAVDSNGDVYVTGWAMGETPRLFLIKHDKNGQWRWTRGYLVAYGAKGFGLAIDKLDQIYVAGSLQGTAYNQTDYIVAKYDSAGNRLWSVTTDAAGMERAERLAVTAKGEVLVTGSGNNWSDVITSKYTDSSLKTLDLRHEGTGAGSIIAVPGATCTGSCSQYYHSGSQVTLTASPAPGSFFAGWGGACTGTGNCTLTIDGNKEASAVFDLMPVKPAADFSASATTGDAPLTVSFSDLSSGTVTSWLWDFGDYSTSTLQNPVHVYSTPGTYSVSLTTTNAGGSSSKTRAGYITATDPGPAAIQPLYDAAFDWDLIRVRAGDLTESLIFNRDITVKIGGGYDFPYVSVIGATTIHGALRVTNGNVFLGNVVMK